MAVSSGVRFSATSTMLNLPPFSSAIAALMIVWCVGGSIVTVPPGPSTEIPVSSASITAMRSMVSACSTAFFHMLTEL